MYITRDIRLMQENKNICEKTLVVVLPQLKINPQENS
jgi:hypothetical protein